ncbi:MAG: hypothetical protein ACOZNI_18700 [Myxococcota bacterium]
MLLVAAAAFACDPALLARFSPPSDVTAEPVTERVVAEHAGTKLSGAQVAFRSAWPVRAWQAVLEHPELQETWHPPEFGTERVDLIEATDYYQRIGISILFGAVTVRRQVIVRIDWHERADDRLSNCWRAGVPEEWKARVAAWSDDSPWQRLGLGGWDIVANEGGGSRVAYQIWTEADLMPAPVTAWAMSRTLPNLMRAFEARVGQVKGDPR